MNTKKILASLLLALILIAGAIHALARSLHVAVTGNGARAAVLIPGFTCSGEIWDETVKKLSSAYTCHVITFAGFAGQPAEANPHLRSWMEDIAGYIRDSGLDKPVVIGHSIGGGMAMMLAAAYPDLVSRIVVVDALPCLAAVQNPSFKADTMADCTSSINRYTSMSDSTLHAVQSRTTPMLCADASRHALITSWAVKSDRRTMGQIYCEFLNTDLRQRIAAITCPALILLEAPFRNFDAAMQAQYAALRNKQILYSGKGLHFIMYDDKDWYLQQLNSLMPQ